MSPTGNREDIDSAPSELSPLDAAGTSELRLGHAKRSLRVVFLHPSKEDRDTKGQLVTSFIQIVPMGLFSMADWLSRAGFDAAIVHVGLEAILFPERDVLDIPDLSSADLIAIPLHWHFQTDAALSLLKRARKRFRDCRFVMGGFTASAFHEALLLCEDGPDFVVVGDGEFPMVELCEHLVGQRNLVDTSNLAWKMHGKVYRSSKRWAASNEELSLFRFGRLDLMLHGRGNTGRWLYRRSLESSDGLQKYAAFCLEIGRGCDYSCSFCGGGKDAHASHSARNGIVFRDPRAVVDDILSLRDQGVEAFHICFDPPGLPRNYYGELFSLIRQTGFRPAVIFEAFSLPDENLLKDIQVTFDSSHSQVVVSPDAGSPKARCTHRGPRIADAELASCVHTIRSLGLQPVVYYSVFPEETLDQIVETLRFARSLAIGAKARIEAMPIEVEPLAPWQLDPSAYGLQTVPRTLETYRQRHRHMTQFGGMSPEELGYAMADAAGKTHLLRQGSEDTREVMRRFIEGISLSHPGQRGDLRRTILAYDQHVETALPFMQDWPVDDVFVVIIVRSFGLDDVMRLLREVERTLHHRANVSLWSLPGAPPSWDGLIEPWPRKSSLAPGAKDADGQHRLGIWTWRRPEDHAVLRQLTQSSLAPSVQPIADALSQGDFVLEDAWLLLPENWTASPTARVVGDAEGRHFLARGRIPLQDLAEKTIADAATRVASDRSLAYAEYRQGIARLLERRRPPV